jgi:hypothetical protein
MRRLILCAAALLAGCASTPPVFHQPKAHHSEFKDTDWSPEEHARTPLNLPALPTNVVDILMSGIYAFDGTTQILFKAHGDPATGQLLGVHRSVTKGGAAVTWNTGNDVVYRNGKPVSAHGQVEVRLLDDDQVRMRSLEAPDYTVIVGIESFDIGGRPVRQLLRDYNNQPTDLAWYVDPEARFQFGARAYRLTYRLTKDEVSAPSKTAFTGSNSLAEFMRSFSAKAPYCLPYVNVIGSHPVALAFDRPGSPKSTRGTVRFRSVDSKELFCAPVENDVARKGTWRITRVNGTRTLVVTPPASVASTDLGVQPVNRKALGIGFAEVRPEGASRTQVLPVRIVKKNEPIVDFRLRFNATAAHSLRSALSKAQEAKRHHEQQNQQNTTKDPRKQ